MSIPTPRDGLLVSFSVHTGPHCFLSTGSPVTGWHAKGVTMESDSTQDKDINSTSCHLKYYNCIRLCIFIRQGDVWGALSLS